MADPAHNEKPSKQGDPSPAQIKEALAQAKSILAPEIYGLLQKIADTYLRARGLIKAGKITTQQLRRLLRVPLLKKTPPDPAEPQDPQGSA